ncbi:hypothetical protein BDV95DRAFT_602057 [Massariosphaeria phaeospora]|uniref:Uncharacterized protein n=1 Tax=Massariosphaeria phaeospora TaxID=100035 RepID=A0A7C8IM55_9PLEO|nr:hypothetical protein BDV95DRAFT_602057 [Massariosphaeria phaeospora]
MRFNDRRRQLKREISTKFKRGTSRAMSRLRGRPTSPTSTGIPSPTYPNDSAYAVNYETPLPASTEQSDRRLPSPDDLAYVVNSGTRSAAAERAFGSGTSGFSPDTVIGSRAHRGQQNRTYSQALVDECAKSDSLEKKVQDLQKEKEARKTLTGRRATLVNGNARKTQIRFGLNTIEELSTNPSMLNEETREVQTQPKKLLEENTKRKKEKLHEDKFRAGAAKREKETMHEFPQKTNAKKNTSWR